MITVLIILFIIGGLLDWAIVYGGSHLDEELSRLQEEMNNGDEESTLHQGRAD